MNEAAAKSHRVSAGVLAVLVHLAFLALLVFGLTWQTKEPPAMVVDLWSKLPGDAPPPPATVLPPAPAPKPAPVKKVEPPPPAPTLKAKPEIAFKEKPKPEKIKPPEKTHLKEPPVPQEQKRELQKQMEQKRLEQIRLAANRQAEITRELVAQAEAAQTRAEMARQAQMKQSAAAQSIIDDYKNRIKARIRSKLNRSVCGEGNPQVEVKISLLPTGELSSNPVVRKGSNLPACDKAVTDAIQSSEPLPVPPQTEIFSEFRNLDLIFKPNE